MHFYNLIMSPVTSCDSRTLTGIVGGRITKIRSLFRCSLPSCSSTTPHLSSLAEITCCPLHSAAPVSAAHLVPVRALTSSCSHYHHHHHHTRQSLVNRHFGACSQKSRAMLTRLQCPFLLQFASASNLHYIFITGMP